MRNLKLALLATAAVAGLASAASAADLIVSPEPLPVVDNYATGFDWNRPYAGFWLSGQTDSIYGLGADLGVNVLLNDSMLVGVEGDLAWLGEGDTVPDDSWQAQLHGKLGFASGNFAFYGLAGVGYNDATYGYTPVGVGIEAALSDSITAKAEYQYQWDWDDDDQNAHVAKVGLNFHF